jgi:hypothetical protein
MWVNVLSRKKGWKTFSIEENQKKSRAQEKDSSKNQLQQEANRERREETAEEEEEEERVKAAWLKLIWENTQKEEETMPVVQEVKRE